MKKKLRQELSPSWTFFIPLLRKYLLVLYKTKHILRSNKQCKKAKPKTTKKKKQPQKTRMEGLPWVTRFTEAELSG